MRNLAIRSSLLAALVFGLSVAVAGAASLQLKDGTIVQGTYLGGTSQTVNFEVNGALKQYNVSDVLLIDFGNAPGPPVSSNLPATSGSTAAQMPATATANDAPASTAPGDSITVPAGTHLLVRMIDRISSKTNQVGDRFQASLAEPLAVGDTVVAPKDALVYGRLVSAQQAGRIEGQSELRLELTGIQINGQIVSLVTSDYNAVGKSRGKQSAERAGVGAGLGALIGALAGGGKGAAIGAGLGAGTAGAVQVLTHGPQIQVPSETELDFTVSQPFTVPMAS